MNKQTGSGFSGSGDRNANFGHSAQTLLGKPEIQNAKNVVVVAEGDDGRPQIWASGDQRQAQDLYQRGAETLGIKEPMSADA